MHLSQQNRDATAANGAAPENADDLEKESVRLTIRLSGDALKSVRALAKKRGISINEFMRRAVSTEAYILEQTGNGARILIQDKGGRQKEIVFLP